jgi:hypothetical protein
VHVNARGMPEPESMTGFGEHPDLAGRMPITVEVARQLDTTVFSGSIVVHVNHLLDDVLAMNELFANLGASVIFVPVLYGQREPPSDLPYTSVYARAEDGGYAVYVDRQRIAGPTNPFDQAVRSAIVEAFVQQPAGPTGAKVLILEDGGYHYDVLPSIESCLSSQSRSIVGVVEQTQNGLRMAQRYLQSGGECNHPILSVARSKLKMRYESRFLAQRIIEEISLLSCGFGDFLLFRDVLLVGYGILGRALGMAARRLDCRVFVMDVDHEIRLAAMRDGLEVVGAVFPELFESVPIIVGATGCASFTLPMFEQFLLSSASRLCLASASSGRIEFSGIIRFFEASPEQRALLAEEFEFLSPVEDVHVRRVSSGLVYSFSYRGDLREVVLLAEGFPANFYRAQSESLPSRVIDPINAEILALCEYALKHHRSLGKNKIYLLGRDHLPGLMITEEQILEQWVREHHIVGPMMQGGVWDMFRPHPCELLLASRS